MASLVEKGYYNGKGNLSEDERKKMEEEIKKSLHEIVNEQQGEKNHPGISVTQSVQRKEKEFNNEYQSDVEDKMKDYASYDAGDEDNNEDYVRQDIPKFEPDDDQQEYIEDIERGAGPHHLRYDLEPSDKFKDRATKAIKGDSQMGNKTYGEDENGNTAPVWGASDEEFGEKLVDQANRRKERTDDAQENLTSFGDDIETSDKEKKTRSNAFEESIQNNKNLIKDTKKSNKMKRLNFEGKRQFNGKENALNLIPESYKVDGTKFEMTDGNETYTIRWEVDDFGNGKPLVLEAENKEAMNEDVSRVKELMGFDSKQNLGILKGEKRLEEDKKFEEIKKKTESLLTEQEENENKILRLSEVDGKLKKKHIPQLAEKPLKEAAKKMANNRLAKYNTKFSNITEAYPIEDKIEEGMNYDQLNYIIEEAIKEASAKSLLKENIEKPTLNEEGTNTNPKKNAPEETHEMGELSKATEEKPSEERTGVAEEEEVHENENTNPKKGAPEETHEMGELSKATEETPTEERTGVTEEEDYDEEQGDVPGEQDVGPDEYNEGDHMDEQHGGHDPSAGAGEGLERVVNGIVKLAKKMLDKEAIGKVIQMVDKKLGELATGTGSATGTGTTGYKRESVELAEQVLNEVEDQYGGYDPSGSAGAGAERVVNAILKSFQKLGDKEAIMKAWEKTKETLQDMAAGAGGATGTGTGGVPRESEQKTGSLIDEGYYDDVKKKVNEGDGPSNPTEEAIFTTIASYIDEKYGDEMYALSNDTGKIIVNSIRPIMASRGQEQIKINFTIFYLFEEGEDKQIELNSSEINELKQYIDSENGPEVSEYFLDMIQPDKDLDGE